MPLITFSAYEIIKDASGKQVIMYKNFTYSFKNAIKTIAYCSKYMKLKCQARLKLDRFGNLLVAKTEHNHVPPLYYTDAQGRHLKLTN